MSLTTFPGAVIVLVALTVACGGESSGGSSQGSAGNAGTSSAGGSSGQGGAAGSATGGSPTGGSPTGGSSTGGSATGGTATGGSATGGSAGTAQGGGSSSCDNCNNTLSGFTCCDGSCRNLDNDPKNCGMCGKVCSGGTSMCQGGDCVAPPCTAELCAPDASCCGAVCCAVGQLCCQIMHGGPSPAEPTPECADPVDGTCPAGCPACVCAAPDTPISTPHGDVAIASLKPGDLVYGVEQRGIVVVPVLRVNRAAVKNHVMVDLRLASGSVLELSPGHPTADGRLVGDLHVGERIDGVAIVSLERVPYHQEYTYDILTGSTSGAYFAGGVLIGSTLAATSVPRP